MHHRRLLTAALALTLPLGACSQDGQGQGISAPMDAETQAALTPDRALEMLKEGNRRFLGASQRERNLLAQARGGAAGQYPFAAVLGCIDSRVPVEMVFDQGFGDLFVARVAGNIAPADIIGSLEYSAKFAGSKLILVLGHTQCGAVKGACDQLRHGSLTGLLQAIEPAVQSAAALAPGERSSKNKKLVAAAIAENVRLVVQALHDRSPALAELCKAGDLRIVGAVYDVASGEARFLDEE